MRRRHRRGDADRCADGCHRTALRGDPLRRRGDGASVRCSRAAVRGSGARAAVRPRVFLQGVWEQGGGHEEQREGQE